MEIVHVRNQNRDRTATGRHEESNLSFSTYLETVKPRIDERIMLLVGSGGEGSMDRRLAAPLGQGKRMRAGLLMLLFETYGQEGGREMAMDLASAVEIAHAASLIVDDMLDEDDTRRGMPTMHMTKGHKGAILSTIGLLSYPYQIASRYGEECVLGLAMTQRGMVQGASMEMKGVPPFRVGVTYDSIIENKTGLLFGLAARYGAMASGCSPATTELCHEFGRLTGKAMQIADDVTDLESLLNGKKTGIGGSEAILLRCCLGQTNEGREDPDPNVHEQVNPLGNARRKDIEDRLRRYLDAAIDDAVGAAQRLLEGNGKDEQRDRAGSEIPELQRIPAEITAMVLNERK
jgi:geranylgeranyl diphosphate synthase type II